MYRIRGTCHILCQFLIESRTQTNTHIHIRVRRPSALIYTQGSASTNAQTKQSGPGESQWLSATHIHLQTETWECFFYMLKYSDSLWTDERRTDRVNKNTYLKKNTSDSAGNPQGCPASQAKSCDTIAYRRPESASQSFEDDFIATKGNFEGGNPAHPPAHVLTWGGWREFGEVCGLGLPGLNIYTDQSTAALPPTLYW